jgi:DNA helicase-2/ATP-dependent DNA helicase PcrA
LNEPPSPSPFWSDSKDPEQLLKNLTAEQAAAVTHGEGPQVIYAGPGSGKTQMLITRAVYLLARGLASPNQIVVVTFTNNAASECMVRIQDRLGPGAISGMSISTFHALCSRILRHHAPAFGRSDNFTIYDQREVRTVVDYVIADKERTGVQEQLERFGACSPAEVYQEISLAKNRLWTPDFYEQHAEHPVTPLVAAVWRELDRELTESNAVDFDDLLSCCVRLLGEHPDLLMAYRTRWRWLLVDEIQDSNYAQMGLLRLLAAPDGNVTVVGDTDQSLYKWRGAEPRNLRAFSEVFNGHREVALGRNFRSKEEIVRAAERLIAHNTHRPKIEFVSDRGPGGHVQVRSFENEYVEAAWTASEIGRQIRSGLTAEKVLVMARTTFATQAVQRALAQASIKHRVLGSLGLYERAEIKDALSYLSLLVNPDDAVALRRAIAVPRRGVGDVSTAAIVEYARAQQLDLISACTHAEQLSRVRARTRENMIRFGNAMLKVRAEHEAGRSLGHTVAATLMIDGGLVQYHQRRRDRAKRSDDRHDADRVLEDLRSVCRAASVYQEQQGALASLLGFLEQAVGLHSQELSRQDPVVTVSTIHRAKGTQASLVFLCACEERVTPSWRALESGDVEDLEEERRGFYVAMTRAEDVLVLTWCEHRSGQNTDGPSRFIAEAGV